MKPVEMAIKGYQLEAPEKAIKQSTVVEEAADVQKLGKLYRNIPVSVMFNIIAYTYVFLILI